MIALTEDIYVNINAVAWVEWPRKSTCVVGMIGGRVLTFEGQEANDVWRIFETQLEDPA